MARTGSEIKITDELGEIINPATESKQDEIITELGAIKNLASKDAQLSNMMSRVATDSVDDCIVYCGRAKKGSGSDEAIWQIVRYDESVDEISMFAGTGIYDQIWDNRESLSYS